MLRSAAKRIALLFPPIRNLVQQRDEAFRELDEIRSRVCEWQTALRPMPGDAGGMPDWFLPPGAHVAAAPQRYSNNYQKYVERGGMMHRDDINGFVRHNPHNAFDRVRFYFLEMTMDLIAAEKLDGDIAELGVDKGNSASVLAQRAERLCKHAYLFDTFEGFSDKDLVGAEARHRGGYTDTSLDLVRENVQGGHVHFVKGWFPESTSQIPDDLSFCLVHLDCDLYRPFASALDYFWPRLVPGGFLVMHDYTTLYWEGVEKAVDDFFADKPESIIPIPDMAGTVVVRKLKNRL